MSAATGKSLCPNCFAAYGALRNRQQQPATQPGSVEEQKAFTDALAAALLADAQFLASRLSPKDSLTAPGLTRVILTIDDRVGELAISTLDKHSMVRPLGLWRTDRLWELAAEIQALIDTTVEARGDE